MVAVLGSYLPAKPNNHCTNGHADDPAYDAGNGIHNLVVAPAREF